MRKEGEGEVLVSQLVSKRRVVDVLWGHIDAMETPFFPQHPLSAGSIPTIQASSDDESAIAMLNMAAPLPRTPYNHHVQQLQQQYVPRRPSPLSKYSSFGKQSDDEDTSTEEDDEDDDDDDNEEVIEEKNDGKLQDRRTSTCSYSDNVLRENKLGKQQQQQQRHSSAPLSVFAAVPTESASSINNENRNTQIKTVYPVLQKSYSISNNDLLDPNSINNNDDSTRNSNDSYSDIERTSPHRPTIKLSPSIPYAGAYISSDLSDSAGAGGSRSTSVSGNSNISTLNGILDEQDMESYREYQYEEMVPIPMFVHGDHVLIFSSDSMKELTVKYGITGQLAGTLPLAPQQNSLLGFPWRLSLYEVLWCLNEKIGVLIDSEDVIKEGYVQDFMYDDNKRKVVIEDLQERLNVWRDEKQKEIEEQMKKLNIIRKDKKGLKPLDNNGLVSSASMPDLQQVLNEKEKKEREIEEAKRQAREMHEKSKKNKIVFMETPSDDSRVSFLWDRLVDKYYDNSNHHTYRLLKKMIDNEVEKMHFVNKELCYEKIWMNYMMYKYLKSNLEYSLLPGMRFGGVFVSYPGDPLRYHAQQIIETREYYDEDIGLFRISNRGRLATGVRKVWVVGGCVDDYNGKQDIADRLLGDDKDDGYTDNDSNNNRVRRRSKRTNSVDASKIRCFSIEWAGF